jgi:hypothetical protein
MEPVNLGKCTYVALVAIVHNLLGKRDPKRADVLFSQPASQSGFRVIMG